MKAADKAWSRCKDWSQRHRLLASIGLAGPDQPTGPVSRSAVAKDEWTRDSLPEAKQLLLGRIVGDDRSGPRRAFIFSTGGSIIVGAAVVNMVGSA